MTKPFSQLNHKCHSGHCKLDSISTRLSNHKDYVVGFYQQFRLSSHFQAIYSAKDAAILGFEALIRPDHGGSPVTPEVMFKASQRCEDLVTFDRLCRTIHATNFVKQSHPDKINLFLNVHPWVVANGPTCGAFMASLLEKTGLNGNQVVIEILEGAIENDINLKDTVDYYRSLNFKVAIDDFGKSSSNLDRLWEIEPDIVKLDGHIIRQATCSEKAKRSLPHLVSFIHESGASVLIEGVESQEQVMIGLEIGADFLQGYYFHRPIQTPHQTHIDGQIRLKELLGCSSDDVVLQSGEVA